jgi:hypothetical protein
MYTTCSCANPDCMINGCLIARSKRENVNLIERYKVDYIIETNPQYKECRLCKVSQATAIKLGWDGFEDVCPEDNDPVLWMEREILKYRKEKSDLILWLKDMIRHAEVNTEKLEEEHFPPSWILSSSSESEAYRKVINYLKDI